MDPDAEGEQSIGPVKVQIVNNIFITAALRQLEPEETRKKLLKAARAGARKEKADPHEKITALAAEVEKETAA
eukprot:7140831-Pyramimonas_sp.AAC.1